MISKWICTLSGGLAALRCLLCLGLLALAGPASADTPIALFKSFAGNVNFVGTQATLRTAPNGTNACSVVAATATTSATLSGIPTGAKILSAQLYWAGSGSTKDYTVTFEGASVAAPTARQYATTFASGGTNYDFFSGAADVTTQVQAKGNGTYRFADLTVNSGTPFCAVEAVLGGWALAVVYSLPTETFRVLNLYEGFQSVQNSSVTLTLSNFNIPPLIAGQTGRIAHITWEGDPTISGGGENLSFNGTNMTDSLNPAGNQFNSVSNINNDSNSYGVDFDAYAVASPVIASGQTSAKTIYTSGQDLVLLNAEIIAVPNTPTADIAVTQSVDQALALGQTAVFTYNVSNNGPAADPGPITLTNTLPASVGYVQAGGDDWTCSVSGQSLTCKYNVLLDSGATASPLSVMVLVNTGASGDSITNTVAVSGTLFDNVGSNNSSSVAYPLTIPGYVFTNAICTKGVAFGANQPCKFLDWSAHIAGNPQNNIYITLLNTTGVPTPLSTTIDTLLPMKFALSCQNPLADNGTQATFPSTGVTLPLCAANSATPTSWSASQTFTVKANSPTIATSMSLVYADAGKIKLFMSDNASPSKAGASGPVVMKPAGFLMKIYRPASGSVAQLNNPAAADGSGAAFAHVGELFTIEISATTADASITVAKNYGREISPKTVKLTQATAVDGSGKAFVELTDLPVLNGALNAFVKGVASGANYSWDEVGILNLTPSMPGGDYLTAGNVLGTGTNVGRFIPDHFDTVVPQLMACSVKLGCPASVSGMVYSGQPFLVTVTARHSNGAALANYTGTFARAVALSGWDAAGSLAQQNPPATPTGSQLYEDDGSAKAAAALAAADFGAGVGTSSTSYTLVTPYLYSKPQPQSWVAPTLVAVRAIDTDLVTSRRVAAPVATPPDTSATVEGAEMIVSGRMLLANAYGSELLSMPIGATAQYWDGANWVISDTDSVSVFSPATTVFSNCLKNLAGKCSGATSVVGVSSSTNVTLAAGRGSLRLKATGSNNTGSVDLMLTSPSWLPSTVARAAFGVYRSGPVTYIREMY